LKFPHSAVIVRAVEVVGYIITACVAYLLGSIPTGYLVAKSRGIDIRTVGSGNIGATNVFRILGKPAGIFVLTVDALKGFVACFFVGSLIYQLLVGPLEKHSATHEFLEITGGFLAILGHNYTCWLKFKGGKGIATSAGVVLGLLPIALTISLGGWLLALAISRYVSVASIVAALILPFGAWWYGYSPRMIVVAAAIGVLAIYKHRTNIQRLRAGTENRIGKTKESAP
jgi:acyl phosphate:glycerol-3-phosphate acyltransferase